MPTQDVIAISLSVCVVAFIVTRLRGFRSRSDQIPGAILTLFIGLVTVLVLDFPWNAVASAVVLALAVWWILTATRRHAERIEQDQTQSARLDVIEHVRDAARQRHLIGVQERGWKTYRILEALTLECREARSAIATAPAPDPCDSAALQKRIDEEAAVKAMERDIVKVFLRDHADTVYLLLKDIRTEGFNTFGMEGQMTPNITFVRIEKIRAYLGGILHSVGGEESA